MKIKEIIAEKVIKIAEKAAEISCGSTSMVTLYQAEEPKNLEAMLKAMKAEK